MQSWEELGLCVGRARTLNPHLRIINPPPPPFITFGFIIVSLLLFLLAADAGGLGLLSCPSATFYSGTLLFCCYLQHFVHPLHFLLLFTILGEREFQISCYLQYLVSVISQNGCYGELIVGCSLLFSYLTLQRVYYQFSTPGFIIAGGLLSQGRGIYIYIYIYITYRYVYRCVY